MKFMDTEPEGATDKNEEESKFSQDEIRITQSQFNALKASERIAKKLQAEVEESVQKKAQEAEEREKEKLATQGKVDELREYYEKKLKAERDEAELKDRKKDLHLKLAPHFDNVFIKGEGVEKLISAEDVDAEIAEMLKNEAYQRYRIDVQAEQTQTKRATPGISPSAGTKPAHTGKNLKDLQGLVNSGDRDAAREMEQRLMNGETL
jgi:hypothetical protein